MNKKYNNLVLIGFAIAGGLFSCTSEKQPSATSISELDYLYSGIAFKMPRVAEPEFPSNTVSIEDFGAISDGTTKNTEAFRKAIGAIEEKGGGRVIVPRGVWYTGPIILKSNINLHLEAGALIVFSKDFDDYPLIETSFEGLNTYRCLSPISGKDLENIAITGNGIIDGSGDAWRPVKIEKLTAQHWKKLVASGGVLSDDGKVWYPSQASKNGDSKDNFNVPSFTEKEQFEKVKDFLRPVMVSLVNCKRVLLDGPTFQNSPAWNIHPMMCEDVIIRNLTVRNPWYSQNGDGLDLESTKNALVYNNSFDVGDDAICIKSGKNEDGRKRGIPTENVIIDNNIVYHGHGGFTIGSEMSGGVRNVHISNCTFIGTDIGLRFKSTRGRGGVVENIHISDIDMIDIPAEAIRFNMFYEGKSPIPEDGSEAVAGTLTEVPPVTEETPSFRNIYMKNITVNGAGAAVLMQGLPEMNLQSISLTNAVFNSDKGISMVDATGITFKNVQLRTKSENAVIVFNSNNIHFDGFTKQEGSGNQVRILGAGSTAVQFVNSDVQKTDIALGDGVIDSAVEIK